MSLNELKLKVKNFEKKAGFDKTEAQKLIEMIEHELLILKNNSQDKETADHQIMDILVLLFQVANRFDTDLDKEWDKHFKKSGKYMK